MSKRYYFEVTDEQEKNIALVVSMMKTEFDIEVKEMKARRNSRYATPVGTGFGDCVWRVDYDKDEIQASFARPCWQSKACKSSGMKWNHAGGYWYAPNEQKYADLCALLKMNQVESVAKKG